MSIIVLAPPVVNFCGADFSTFTPEDQNKLMCCFMENGRNGDETAKYVFLMVLADPERSLSHFLLLFHIFNMVLPSFLSLFNSVQMQGKILFRVSHSSSTASSPYTLSIGCFMETT